jgi:toxin ParE1/3/4
MAGFRISGPARADLATLLTTSLERWGEAGRARYAALLVAAMRAIARDPDGPTTRDRAELAPGIRSCHLRHARRGPGVHDPVHVVFYRRTGSVIEIARVLHERMEPALHVTTTKAKRSAPVSK